MYRRNANMNFRYLIISNRRGRVIAGNFFCFANVIRRFIVLFNIIANHGALQFHMNN